jgi:hypothetical protein
MERNLSLKCDLGFSYDYKATNGETHAVVPTERRG